VSQLSNYRRNILLSLAGGLMGWVFQGIVNIDVATVLEWMGYPGFSDFSEPWIQRFLQNQYCLSMNQTVDAISTVFLIQTMIYAGFFCGVLSFFMSVGFQSGNPFKSAIKRSLVALLAGVIIGAAASYPYLLLEKLRSMVCYFFGLDTFISVIFQMLLLGLGWGIFGMAIAFSVGLPSKRLKQIRGYSLAGLLGGLVTGMIYCLGITVFPEANPWALINSTGNIDKALLIQLFMSLILALSIEIGICVFHKKEAKKKQQANGQQTEE
jgi:hypothetical protein